VEVGEEADFSRARQARARAQRAEGQERTREAAIVAGCRCKAPRQKALTITMASSSPKGAGREGKHPIPSDNAAGALASFIAADPKAIVLVEQIRKIAASTATVLIQGESGTGKELVAMLVHYLGASASEPLVKIDCASLPEPLMESELFGYERGAFTGATEMKRGRLELAGSGTVLLDEISELSPVMQAKLLRVLEEKRFDRLGGAKPVTLPERLRFIAITSLDLAEAVKQKDFRDDLFYRLNVLPLVVPALRQRRNDIAPLAKYFLAHFAERHARPKRELSREALEALENYDCPGNIRELRNICERLAVAGEGTISLDDMPAHIGKGEMKQMTLAELERAYIAEVLDFTRGKKSKAAEILGISRKNLLEKRKRYKLDK
jgi:transcriptional regulator with PAS, ATPase and Fis domain